MLEQCAQSSLNTIDTASHLQLNALYELLYFRQPIGFSSHHWMQSDSEKKIRQLVESGLETVNGWWMSMLNCWYCSSFDPTPSRQRPSHYSPEAWRDMLAIFLNHAMMVGTRFEFYSQAPPSFSPELSLRRHASTGVLQLHEIGSDKRRGWYELWQQ